LRKGILMTTKQLLEAELDKLSEDELGELLRIARSLSETKGDPRKGETGLLSKLREVSIEAPEDFAANLDLYVSGEKTLGNDQRLR
jgi:hypothetical protein